MGKVTVKSKNIFYVSSLFFCNTKHHKLNKSFWISCLNNIITYSYRQKSQNINFFFVKRALSKKAHCDRTKKRSRTFCFFAEKVFASFCKILSVCFLYRFYQSNMKKDKCSSTLKVHKFKL